MPAPDMHSAKELLQALVAILALGVIVALTFAPLALLVRFVIF